MSHEEYGVNVCNDPRISLSKEFPMLAYEDRVFSSTAEIVSELKKLV